MDRAPIFPVFAAGGTVCTGARVLDCALAPVATAPAMITAAQAVSHCRTRVVRATIRLALLTITFRWRSQADRRTSTDPVSECFGGRRRIYPHPAPIVPSGVRESGLNGPCCGAGRSATIRELRSEHIVIPSEREESLLSESKG